MNNENRCWTGLTVRSAWAVGILCSLLGCGGNKSPSDADVEAGPSCTATSADDEPDVAGTDANCDGVDGVVTDAVFVDAARGSDASAGTREAPVASVGKGIEVAVENGKHMVLLAAGTYSGTVTLADGISIHGGYEPTDGWARPALTTRSPVTILTATSSPVVLGESIASATRISGVGVTGPNVSAYGVSSVAMRLVDSAGLTLEDCELRAGTGGPGATGATPAQSTIVGTAGGPGLISKCYGPAANCDHNSPTFTAQSLSRTAAVCGGCGRGGIGSWAWADDTVTRNGGPGDSWNGTACVDSGSSGPGSAGQATGPTPATGPGGLAGAPGAPGAPGVGATSAGAITEGGFVTVLAESGGQGSVGGGGGGGSAGAYRGCPAPDDGNFLVGGTGAYGGSGGCGGAGGGGGAGGAPSIALVLWRSTPLLLRTLLASGTGGTGGAGGAGGLGAAGGPGGTASVSTTRCPSFASGQPANRGGDGGAGGQGGQGGQGGGGAGGSSIALLYGDGATLAEGSTDVFVEPGVGGAPGAGVNSGSAGAACTVFRVSDSACLATLDL